MRLRKIFLLIVSIVFLSINLFADDAVENDFIFTGSGDDIILIEKELPDLPYILLVLGNASERHFSIVSYDENANYLDLLVNTSNYYFGVVPIDLPVGSITRMLEISAVGNGK